jgi:dynein heavy chain
MEPKIQSITPPTTPQEHQRTQNILENAVVYGTPILLERLQETIDQLFEPLIKKQLVKQGTNRYIIKLAEGKEIEYDLNFRLYLTTKLPKPHYTPEVCVMLTMLNFQVTQDGLEDQLLNLVVREESQQLYQ